jgi:cyclophilin family peptidyl-prolyl cis-trans isomerase
MTLKKILIIILIILIIYLIHCYLVKYNIYTRLKNYIILQTQTNPNTNFNNKLVCDYNKCYFPSKQKIQSIVSNNNDDDIELFDQFNQQNDPSATDNATENLLDNLIDSIPNRQYVYMDIAIGDKIIGRVNIELFVDIVPFTCNNFLFMINNHYKGSIFHRVINNFMIQGGDYINNNGTGSNSIYGDRFDDENFNIKHDSKYLLSMANAGPNTNGCQFFITLNNLPNLDNKHVVFGKIVDESSFDIINQIANINTDENDKPLIDCIIADCGLIE